MSVLLYVPCQDFSNKPNEICSRDLVVTLFFSPPSDSFSQIGPWISSVRLFDAGCAPTPGLDHEFDLFVAPLPPDEYSL